MSSATLIDFYQSKLSAKKLDPDPKQLSIVKELSQFLSASPSFLQKLFNTKKTTQGFYIYGPVGRGKTMIMDLVYEFLPTKDKKRTHFHIFMQDVHKRLKRLRDGKKSSDDIMKKLGAEVAKNLRYLCFDEFVVEDIADAMILGRLFEQLFAEGVIIIATSNTKPDDLYKGGLQRERFLPFIDLLKKKTKTLSLDGPRDYRLYRLQGKPTYLTPLGDKTEKQLRKIFMLLCDNQVQPFTTIEHQQRKLVVPESGHGAAYFHFNDLCAKSYGAADYLLLAKNFRTILIEGIPKLNDTLNDRAKRFITLIDVLYDNKIHLFCQAADAAQKLYTKGKLAKQFERTASRLMEMQSDEYNK